MEKPDPRFYALACERLGVAPQEVVFIDDFPANTEGARAAGIKTILFENTERTIRALGGRIVIESLGTSTAEAGMTGLTNREAAERFFAAWERWDLDTLEALVADDAVDTRPQSGEHFVGRANIMGMYHEVPGPPEITWRSIRGGPDAWVAEGIVEYGDGPFHLIGIVEFADGKMIKADYYFADPFEPPESRVRWAVNATP